MIFLVLYSKLHHFYDNRHFDRIWISCLNQDHAFCHDIFEHWDYKIYGTGSKYCQLFYLRTLKNIPNHLGIINPFRHLFISSHNEFMYFFLSVIHLLIFLFEIKTNYQKSINQPKYNCINQYKRCYFAIYNLFIFIFYYSFIDVFI